MANLLQSVREYISYQKDKSIVENRYRQFHKTKIDWKNPKTYSEKVQVYKLSKEMESLWPYADKWAVRKIVEKRVGPEILNKVYGVWKNASKINFKKLPKQFVLKATHGSAWNIVVKNKNQINEEEIRNRLNSWLKINYCDWYGKERQYKLIKPKIICEEYLEDKNKKLLDYKFFCFGGRVSFIHVTIDRFTDHKRNFYDRDWKKLPFEYGPYPSSPKKYPRPKNLMKMIEIAENLSSDLKHARVDLYNIDRKIYFGEITLTPSNGEDIFHPEKYDRIYGSIFKL